MKPIILIVCAILTACSAPETPITFPVQMSTPPMPGAIRRACTPIPDIRDEMDMGLLLTGYSALVEQYTQCRLLNQAKIDWAKQNGL